MVVNSPWHIRKGPQQRMTKRALRDERDKRCPCWQAKLISTEVAKRIAISLRRPIHDPHQGDSHAYRYEVQYHHLIPAPVP